MRESHALIAATATVGSSGHEVCGVRSFLAVEPSTETSPAIDQRRAAILQRLENPAEGRSSGIMDVMGTSSVDWITIAAYENLPGCLQPMAAARA